MCNLQTNQNFYVFQKEGTNPGSLLQTYGGVGRNIAECMSRLDSHPFFISSVGKDANGQTLLNHLTKIGIVSWNIHLLHNVLL